MKSGAPAMAVMAPTGSSAGATMVRARVSAMTTAMAPPNADSGNQDAMVGAENHAHDVRHKKADVADGAADGDGEAGEKRKRQCRRRGARGERPRRGAWLPFRRRAGDSDRRRWCKSRRSNEKPTRKTQARGFDGTAERSPISQKAMPRRLRLGMVVISKNDDGGEEEAVMTPPSSKVLLSIWPSRRPENRRR